MAQTYCILSLPRKDTYLRLEQVTVSPNLIETEKDKQNENTRDLFQLKEQEKTPKKISKTINILNKKFKALVIRLLNELGKRIDELIEKFNKKL